MPATQPRPYRSFQWLRFNLKTMFVMMTLAAVACVWVSRVRQQSAREEAALGTILDLGGQVSVRYEIIGFRTDTHLGKQPPLAPQWLRTLFGEGAFRLVEAVSLDTNLTRRRLGADPSVHEVLLPALADLPELETLRIVGAPQLTDSGLAFLSGLESLSHLSLYASGIRGPGLSHLHSLQSLESLSLDRTWLGPGQLHYLAELPNLKELGVSNTRISDDDLRHLARIQSLDRLDINYTNITDEGLSHLHQLRNLKTLRLKGSLATSHGIARLQAALPDCSVWPSAEELARTAELAAREPIDSELWPEDVHPSHEELLEKIEAAEGVRVGFTGQIPGAPIRLLNVTRSNISGNSLLRLMEEIPDLESLTLVNCNVGEEFFRELHRWPRLNYLYLEGPHITDETLPHLTSIPALTRLTLRDTNVTNSAAEHLSALKKLSRLDIWENRVSQEAISALEAAWPSTQVQ